MQAQAHMAGQVSGQATSQASGQLTGMSQQIGGSVPPQSSNMVRMSWQMDPDIRSKRQQIHDNIMNVLKRPNMPPEWVNRLPDMARRLEEGLFREATSMEEYLNPTTLDRRLQILVKRFHTNRNQNQSLAYHSAHVGTMIPTPGMQQSGNVSTMIPTPGIDTSMISGQGSSNMVPNVVGMGNMVSNNNENGSMIQGNSLPAMDNISSLSGTLNDPFQSQQGVGSISNSVIKGMSLPRVGSQMIPTPGLTNSQSTPMNSVSSSALVHSGVDSLAAATQQQQQQQFTSGQNNRIYSNMNGQISGIMGMGIHHKNPSYGLLNGSMNNGMSLVAGNQHLMNGSSPLNNMGNYMHHSRYGLHPHMNQQRQRPLMHLTHQITPLPTDGYAMNAADLAGSGNLYGSATTSGLQGATSLNSTLPTQKMIPVPGLPAQQSNMHAQQQIQTHSHSQQNNLQMQRGQMNQTYQQQMHQPLKQNIQLHQQQQYQQHHIQQQNQQVQHQVKSEDTQQMQLAATFSAQKQQNIGSNSLNEPVQHDVLHVSNEQMKAHVQQPQSGGPLDHVSPNGQQLSQHQSQNSLQFQEVSPQEHQQCLSQNDSNSLPIEAMPEAISQSRPESEGQLYNAEHVAQSGDERQGQQEVEQSIANYEVTQNNQSQQQSYMETDRMVSNTSRGDTVVGGTSGTVSVAQTSSIPEARQIQYMKQQRWLLFLRHASKCSVPEGHCQMQHCTTARQLWQHIMKCKEDKCTYPRCEASKTLLRHHQTCRDINCPVCGRVRQILLQQRQVVAPKHDGVTSNGLRRPADSSTRVENSCTSNIDYGNSTQETIVNQQPPLKKIKLETSTPCSALTSSEAVACASSASRIVVTQPQSHASQQSSQCQSSLKSDGIKSIKTDLLPVKNEMSGSMSQNVLQKSPEVKKEPMGDNHVASQPLKSDACPVNSSKVSSQVKQELVSAKKELVQAKSEPAQVKQESSAIVPTADSSAAAKNGKPKIKGVSLTELFTPEQIREHITGLRQWVGQSKAKAEKNQAIGHQMSENSCQLCAVEKLTFEPPPIYCTSCGARIKRNAMYYTLGSGDTRHYFCIPCYNDVRGDVIEADGATILKSRLEKRKNDEETEEAWVQCDKCEAWQHQICALFNGRRNEGGQAEYTCPNCYVAEIERGERKPLPQSAVLGAKDLPKTHLSDHIEQRLARRLKQERLDRAKAAGKSWEEVPGAEALVVRVVSSVDKKLEVKQRFLEIFQEEDYPTEFPYKSKVLLLFQKIEGVEVCLFGMYVQEFGSECSQPNQRRVYLSYLDSVKYFRPEVKAVTGEALRTFVYHEILIGYLEYCKKRGLTSCYIWACPPLKGEDYILYCHPEIQKTPKSDKLREWYLTMLKKAMRENIVAELTNLYDHFFISAGECKAKVTAARLPYFDGDYWPGAAEDMIMQLQQAEEDGRKQQKKGKTKKTATKRASKAAAQAELASNASKDALLMQKLGESIFPMKEDFIMVHMQYACAHCSNFIISGKRWACQQCKSQGKTFNLCEKCYDGQQRLDERDWHPVNSREKHSFCAIEVSDVPADTKDKDEIIESEFFDTRQAFLSLCQGNHYQYDTLRRAKHSSMMVLYHLHNPTAPAFVTSCNICHHDIETGQGWRCETCPDFDICNACYQNNGSAAHPHKLTTHPSLADRDAQSKEARQQRVLQLRIMLDLLVHASQCGSPSCQYPNCRRVKGLFRHGMQCKVRASGGCSLCKKMWYILQLHARACKESDCRVPRCKDLKEHLRRLQQQMESRRRKAVMEMMRQRAAEVANNS